MVTLVPQVGSLNLEDKDGRHRIGIHGRKKATDAMPVMGADRCTEGEKCAVSEKREALSGGNGGTNEDSCRFRERF